MLTFTHPTTITLRFSLSSNPSSSPHRTTLFPNVLISNSYFSKPLNVIKTMTTSLKSSKTPIIKSSASNLEATDLIAIKQTLKSRLRDGETLYGLFLLSFSPTLAEIAGLSGYDFVVVDMEHGPGGISEALDCLRALAAVRTPAVLRLPETSATWAKKALDLGPEGIMFPMIGSAEEARSAVSYCRFPPSGVRGSAHTVVRASGYGSDEGYLSNYEEDLLIMCQVESEDGVENAAEITEVDGVDCVQMGPLDLSASMGYLWDPGHKKVREMLRVAESKVLGSKPHGKNGDGKGAYLAGFTMPHDPALELKARGYRMVSGAVDVGLFRSAAVEDVRRFKASLDVDEEGKDTDEKYYSE